MEALGYSEQQRALMLTHQSVKMIRAHYGHKAPGVEPKKKAR